MPMLQVERVKRLAEKLEWKVEAPEHHGPAAVSPHSIPLAVWFHGRGPASDARIGIKGPDGKFHVLLSMAADGTLSHPLDYHTPRLHYSDYPAFKKEIFKAVHEVLTEHHGRSSHPVH